VVLAQSFNFMNDESNPLVLSTTHDHDNPMQRTPTMTNQFNFDERQAQMNISSIAQRRKNVREQSRV
jgi:hypothetical protein